eukprot:NODE_721_length_4810_cov_0.200170.p2 type:complete len:100 gc:universal NODE_721_length_4810_cov_0.200170:888-1187(+)
MYSIIFSSIIFTYSSSLSLSIIHIILVVCISSCSICCKLYFRLKIVDCCCCNKFILFMLFIIPLMIPLFLSFTILISPSTSIVLILFLYTLCSLYLYLL